MKRNFFKKIVLAAFIATIAAAACGCGTEITYYYSESSQDYYTQFAIEIPKTELAAIENTATSNVGDKWTVKAYLGKLALLFNGGIEERDSSDAVTYVVSRSVAKSNDDDDDDDEDTVEPELKRGFLFNTYTYVTDSPFAGFYSALTGETTPTSGSIADVIKNGVTDNSAQKVLPSLTEAFPGIDYSTIGSVKTNFIWNNSRIVPADGEVGYSGRNRVAVWRGTLADADKIRYTYTAPNSVGWYILIAAVGCITVTIIMLATRKSDAKPKMVKMQSGRRVYPRIGGYYNDGSVNRTNRNDNIHVIDPFDDEPINKRETPDEARKDLDDIFFGDDK